jgi:antirestriction protein ArdC
MTKTAPRRDLYADVTATIIEALEAGTKPWARPWNQVGAGGMQLRANGKEYRGINQLILTLKAGARGYASPRWLTFKQAIEAGGAVRKGEKSTEIVFYKTLTVEDRDAPAGEDRTKSIPMLRSYRVFNADQCDGLPARFTPPPIAIASSNERDEAAEAALRSSGATIREGGAQAFYAPGPDFVQMPPFEAFKTTGGFLATLAHELAHWTGHKTRLDRSAWGAFGSKDYAREELVAEIGSAFVMARLGVAGEHMDNHAAYLASWLKCLREDSRAIFKAAAQAQLAADYVLRNAALDEGAGEDEDDGEGEAIAAPAPAPAAPPAPAATVQADLFAAA